jgi:hypothetical protein
MIFILGIRKGEEKMREKRKEKTKDTDDVQDREKGNMKKIKMIVTLWATETRKENQKTIILT